jgi:hypothetical protein
VEREPLLYEDAEEMVEYVAQALKQTSGEMIFYSIRLRWTLPKEYYGIGRPDFLPL